QGPASQETSHGVSSATISRRLSELEEELGARRVERTTRSLRVTDLGRAFHDQCARGLDAIEDAHDLVTSHQERVAGTVRRSTAPTLRQLLLGAIADVRIAHPEVRVFLVETERRLDLRHDDIDQWMRLSKKSANAGGRDDRSGARSRPPHARMSAPHWTGRGTRPDRRGPPRVARRQFRPACE